MKPKGRNGYKWLLSYYFQKAIFFIRVQEEIKLPHGFSKQGSHLASLKNKNLRKTDRMLSSEHCQAEALTANNLQHQQ